MIEVNPGDLTVSEDEQLLALASRDLGQQGQQVVRDTLGVLSHDTTGVSTSGVEVTEQSTVPLLGLLRLSGLDGVVACRVDDVRDGPLDADLGVSVRVRRSQRALLGDGNHVRETSGITVHGGRAGEDNVGDIVLEHGPEEVDGAVDVDIVVVNGALAGFTDRLSLGN